MPRKDDPTLTKWETTKPGQPPDTDLGSWMAYTAYQLIYGHILGGQMGEDLLFVLQNSAGAVALMRDAMKLRESERDFLVLGRMLRPPVATVQLPTVEMCGNKPCATTRRMVLLCDRICEI